MTYARRRVAPAGRNLATRLVNYSTFPGRCLRTVIEKAPIIRLREGWLAIPEPLRHQRSSGQGDCAHGGAFESGALQDGPRLNPRGFGASASAFDAPIIKLTLGCGAGSCLTSKRPFYVRLTITSVRERDDWRHAVKPG